MSLTPNNPSQATINMAGITTQLPIEIPNDQIAEICQRYHIRKVSLFGSILRDDFRPDSDIDILVEFEPGYTPGFAFIDIQDELSMLLGRKVDLNTPQDISRYFRDRVLAEAKVQYVKN
ncbi:MULTISPECIES: nucleotidyltransferase family protein [Tolypothrix]|nr:nucleotidyltransferase family protein [Tolypothrix bouteillei]